VGGPAAGVAGGIGARRGHGWSWPWWRARLVWASSEFQRDDTAGLSWGFQGIFTLGNHNGDVGGHARLQFVVLVGSR